MPGQFDTTTRYLVEKYPAEWLRYLGIDTTGTIDVIDANLSVVSAEVDKVVRVRAEAERLVHLEFQSSYDPTMSRRLLRYNSMLHLPDGLPVKSVLVLLRAQADGPAIVDRYQVELPREGQYLSFDYTVRRVWQDSPDELVHGALGTLPLAPLTNTTLPELPGLLGAMERRFDSEADVAEAGRLRVVTYALLGLRYPTDVIDRLLPGAHVMRDSSTYQAILEEGRQEGRQEGRAEGEQRLLLRVGAARLGPPDETARSQVESITDISRLEQLADRVVAVSSWDELLADLG